MKNINTFEDSSTEIHNPLENQSLERSHMEQQNESQFKSVEDIELTQNSHENQIDETSMTESRGFESLQDQTPVKSNKNKIITICIAAVLGLGGYYFYTIQAQAAAAKVLKEQEAKAAAAATLQRAQLAEANEKAAKEAAAIAAKKNEEAAAAAKKEAERIAAENAKKTKAKSAAKVAQSIASPTLSAAAVERSYQPQPQAQPRHLQVAPKPSWFAVEPN